MQIHLKDFKIQPMRTSFKSFFWKKTSF